MAAPAPYLALALQTTCFAVNDASDAAASRPRMLAAIARVSAQIAASKRFVGQDVRLVVRDAVTYGKANAIDLVRPKPRPCRAQRATGRGEAICLFVCHRNAPRLSR